MIRRINQGIPEKQETVLTIILRSFLMSSEKESNLENICFRYKKGSEGSKIINDLTFERSMFDIEDLGAVEVVSFKRLKHKEQLLEILGFIPAPPYPIKELKSVTSFLQKQENKYFSPGDLKRIKGFKIILNKECDALSKLFFDNTILKDKNKNLIGSLKREYNIIDLFSLPDMMKKKAYFMMDKIQTSYDNEIGMAHIRKEHFKKLLGEINLIKEIFN